MNSNHINEIVLGDKRNRTYRDMMGRPISVGDYFVHSQARSSSVFTSIYKIVNIVDTDTPKLLGTEKDKMDGSWIRVLSWDYAYKLKAVSMNVDKRRGEVTVPPKWVRTNQPGKYDGEWCDAPLEDHKPSTISAVERIVRVDV